MPEKYRRIFACEDRIIPYRFHKGVYEAHYRRDGFKVFACAKDFKEMREKFTAKLLEQMNGKEPFPAPKRKRNASLPHDLPHDQGELQTRQTKQKPYIVFKRTFLIQYMVWLAARVVPRLNIF